jgi:hypothetical protein
MIPPIIVDEYGDLAFFRSAADAERYLEPIDVKNEEYTAYDSVGRRLTLGVARKETRFFYGILKGAVEVVTVRDESGVDAAEELRQLLLEYLEGTGKSTKSLEGAALETLIEQAVQFAGYSY